MWKQASIAVLMFAAVAPVTAGETSEFQGFGASTKGGNDGQMVKVTSLADAGPGTLRSAVEGDRRRIVFDVGGTITLKQPLVLNQPNVTIDGRNAPAPGITIIGKPFIIADAEDVIVRNLRFRESSDDNIRIAGACRRVVIDHCSSTRALDGALDITLDYKTGKRPSEITVCWCLLAGTDKASLIQSVSKLSLHHNLYVNNGQRNPQLHDVQEFDLRNNVVWFWNSYGLRARPGSSGNLVDNAFGPSRNPNKRVDAAVILEVADDATSKPALFLRGNTAPQPFDPNTLATTRREIAAPKIDTVPTEKLLATLVQGVGAQPIDKIDREYLQIRRDLEYRPAPESK